MANVHKIDTNLITLTRHIIAEQRNHREATGSFTLLLSSVCLGCKYVSTSVQKAGLAKLFGIAGTSNKSGDEQKKLDVLADEVFINALGSCGEVSLMVTEEREEAILVKDAVEGKSYAVMFDPLDGSSNIDCGVSVGTIFGIYRLAKKATCLDEALKKGREMVAAGYCMYGASTNLVLSFGHGVHHYILDPSLGEFVLVKENLKIPLQGKIYSVNEGNYYSWAPGVRKYIEECKNASDGKSFSARYIGSMVPDIHRTILYGGIYLYPSDKKSPEGKLRLLYECFPMAFLVEQAGGRADSGDGPILDIIPTSVHQKSPIFIGSKLNVERVVTLLKEN